MGEDEKQCVVIDFRRRHCWHHHLIVDDSLEEIECKKCGQRLNTFFAIKELMRYIERQSHKWKEEKARAELAKEAAEKKSRTKCQHCKKMTRVRVDVAEWKVIERMRDG